MVEDLPALFLPYRKDHGQLLEQIRATQDAVNNSVVFAHIETVGAFTDRLDHSAHHSPILQAIRPDDLPYSTMLFSGHYHKPQTLTGSNSSKIVYVGSPYEVSLAECGEQKRLLFFNDTTNLEIFEEIPIAVGAKHFVIAPSTPISDVVTMDQLQSIAEICRPGDRVVFKCNDFEPGFKKSLDALRERGVRVEIWAVPAPGVAVSAFPPEAARSDGMTDANRCVAGENGVMIRSLNGYRTLSHMLHRTAVVGQMRPGWDNRGIMRTCAVYAPRTFGASTAERKTSPTL